MRLSHSRLCTAAGFRIGSPPGGGQGLVELVEGVPPCDVGVSAAGLDFDRGDMDSLVGCVEGDREQVGSFAGEPVLVLVEAYE